MKIYLFYGVPNIRMVIAKHGYQWILYTKDRKRILGKFRTKKEAVKRERQIQFFKHMKK